MNRIVAFIKTYPYELIVILAFVALFLKYPGITFANLFILLSLVLAYFLYWSKPKLTKKLSPAVLLISLGTYFFFAQKDLAFIFISLDILIALILVYLSMRFGYSIQQYRSTSRIFISGLLILICLPITVNLTVYLASASKNSSLEQKITSLRQTMVNDQGKYAETAAGLSKDPFIADLLAKKSYQQLSDYSQNMMVAKGLNYLIISDSDGVVVVRAHRTKQIGDNVGQISEKLKNDDSNQGVYFEQGKAFLAASSSIKSDNLKVGTIVVGQFIDQRYLSDKITATQGCAVLYQNTVSGAAAADGQLLNFFADLRASNLETLSSNSQFDYSDNHIIMANQTMAGAEILLAEKQNNFRLVLITQIILYLLAMISASLLYKLRNHDDTDRHFSFTKQFWKGKTVKPNRQMLRPFQILEIALYCAVLSLALYQSCRAYYQNYPDSKVERNGQVASLSQSPWLTLSASSYSHLAETFQVVLRAGDITSGPNSMQATIKFDSAKISGLSIDFSKGICSKVYDKSIDNQQGLVNLSCELKETEQTVNQSSELAEISFRALKPAVAEFQIDKNYSNILSAKGRSNQITESSAAGERVLISE